MLSGQVTDLARRGPRTTPTWHTRDNPRRGRAGATLEGNPPCTWGTVPTNSSDAAALKLSHPPV